jgi:hypothetical protein
MTTADIITSRLINQQIAGTDFKQPQQIVSWLIAMQAQEYAMAKWAIGLRLPGSSDTIIEKALNEGVILRTHILRPTWHFITPADMRWVLALTAPRVHAFNAYYYRKYELDKKTLTRSKNVLSKSLQGGKHLTRLTLKNTLNKAKIIADSVRLSLIMMNAELDGIICSGPRDGNQFTYALLDERVPPTKVLSPDEALAQLALRYFTTRGPATIADFAWWSGLSSIQAKEGAAMVKDKLFTEMISGKEYLLATIAPGNNKVIKPNSPQATFLMPDYDEYGISYKDRSAIFQHKTAPPNAEKTSNPRNTNPIFNHMLVIDGIVAGTWKPSIKKKEVLVETTSFTSLNKTKQKLVTNAMKRYTNFFSNNATSK